MNILVVAPRFPAFGRKGDQLIALHRIVGLHREGHTVSLYSYSPPKESEEHDAVKQLVQLGIRYQCFSLPFSWLDLIQLFIMVLYGKPVQVGLHSSWLKRKALENFIDIHKPDLVLCVTCRTVELGASTELPIAIEWIDSISMNYHRSLESRKWPLKFLYFLESNRLRHYERDWSRRAVFCSVVSSIDADYIGSDSLSVHPLGVSSAFKPVESLGRKRVQIISFHGNLNYEPNVTACNWFLDRCWPTISAVIPEAEFHIVGRNASRDLIEMCSGVDKVTLVGEVPSIPNYLRQVSVSVAPMRSGSGMQNKVLEACACGVPVVASRYATGGLALVKGEELIEATSPGCFIRAVIDILTDSDLSQQIVERALATVQKKYSWDNLYRRYNKELTESMNAVASFTHVD